MDDYVCPECSLDHGAVDRGSIAARLRTFGPAVREQLSGVNDTEVRTRPAPEVFSALEYAAHLSDAYDAFVDMTEGMPRGANMRDFFWDPDDRAQEQGYNARAVDDVLGELDTNANRLADATGSLGDDDWAVTAQFPWGERDLFTMLQNAVHEGVHHSQDIDNVLRRVSAAD